jgi:peptide/nickel transport system permease protein
MHIDVQNEIWRNNAGKTGIIILAVIVLAAVAGPLLTAHSPTQQTTESLLKPSMAHLLGTNHVGQDIFARLLYGARTSLLVGVGVGFLSTLMAAFFGITAALFGGLYEIIVMRIVDTFVIIPLIIIAILVSAYIKPGVIALIIMISLFSWQFSARIIRSQVLSIRERGYVRAARTFGGGNAYIAIRHILLDVAPLLFVDFICFFRRAVFVEVGLAFLGIISPDLLSWGGVIRNAMDYIYLNAWGWWLLPVGFSLAALIIALTFISHAAEAVLDPRLRSVEVA